MLGTMSFHFGFLFVWVSLDAAFPFSGRECFGKAMHAHVKAARQPWVKLAFSKLL